jgi:DNA (cytosine-5)-methyltransferase 1
LEIKPKVIVVENVRGVLSGDHSRYWNQLRQTLTDGGYKTHVLICDASEMGVAQVRKRVVLIGWRIPKDIEFCLSRIPGGALRGSLSQVDNAPNHSPRTPAKGSEIAAIARRIGQGQKLCNVRASQRSVHTWQIPDVFGKTNRFERTVLQMLLRLRRRQRIRDFGDADPVSTTTLYRAVGRPVAATLRSLQQKGYVRNVAGGHFDLCHTFNGKFRRLSWDKPAPTVDTRFGQPRYYLHPDEDRGFTVREAARIQGFPDTFLFDGPEAVQFRLIGNAVPPPFARCLAEFIRSALLT